MRFALRVALVGFVLGGCGDDGSADVDGGSADVDGGAGSADGARPRRDTGSAGTDAGRIDSGPPVACDRMPERSGEGTYYDADGSGACGFSPVTSGELLVAAMNMPDWAGSEPCGACAHVVGPHGEVTVRIVDLCPECASGDLDMSPGAFDYVADRAAGRVPITWREVPCDVSGPAIWHVKDGSNPYWAAFQLRDHRNRVVRLEAETAGGSFVDLARESYNYFIDESMPGDTITLRATDVYGNVLTESGIDVVEDTDHVGSAQFPPCEGP